jgi:hypothetical protein
MWTFSTDKLHNVCAFIKLCDEASYETSQVVTASLLRQEIISVNLFYSHSDNCSCVV